MSPIGVLVMAYGTPAGPDEVEAYYTDIRRGRPPSPEQLSDLQRRYEAIGGVSPLIERTQAQVARIESHLDGDFVVNLGTKHGLPSIESSLHSLAAAGVEGIVGLVLAPHFSQLSIGEYEARVGAAGAEHGLSCRTIHSWHDLPELISSLATRVKVAIGGDTAAADLMVLFTAHSLPARILEAGDPYPEQLEETAALVAKEVGIGQWRTAWQSAGRTPEPWLGPDVCELLPSLRDEGVRKVVVCPAGFTSDHLEVLYDLDIEARRVARESGLELVRTESINDDDLVCSGLARLVVEESARL